MADESRRWSLEEIETIRRELLTRPAYQVAARERVSVEHLLRLVGDFTSRTGSRILTQNRVRELARAGRTDWEIAVELDLTLNYVGTLRREAGIRRSRNLRARRVEQVRLLVLAGKSDEEIAGQLELSPSYIRRLRIEAGILRPRGRSGSAVQNLERVHGLVKAGKSDEEIAEQLGLSTGYVRQLRVKAGVRIHKPPRRWSLEQVEAMRREVLEEGKTLKQIADREGVTRERIRQLVGNLRGASVRAELRKAQVHELVLAGKSDEEIAELAGLTVGTVRRKRLESGIRRPVGGKKWTRENIIEFARWWYEEFGSLSIADWFPALAKRYGQPDRVERFYATGAPHGNTVKSYFKSWDDMKLEAGIPKSPSGGAGRGHWRRHDKTRVA